MGVFSRGEHVERVEEVGVGVGELELENGSWRVGVGELVGGRILYEVKAGAAGKEKAAA